MIYWFPFLSPIASRRKLWMTFMRSLSFARFDTTGQAASDRGFVIPKGGEGSEQRQKKAQSSQRRVGFITSLVTGIVGRDGFCIYPIANSQLR